MAGKINMKTALITGIGGQDGYYLTKLLLSKGYRVIGLDAAFGKAALERFKDLIDNIVIVKGALQDQSLIVGLLEDYEPLEVYNFAAQSFVPSSWNQAVQTGEVTAVGVTRLLEAIRRINPSIRFYQASSSEVFGNAREVPQRETTPFQPRTPYGVAKAYGHWITVNYRESFGLHANSGILYNHESPQRGTQFVTRKITLGVASIKAGKSHNLHLGNLDARRDWGFAGDYVRAMWMMLQQSEADDYVIGTGETHSVRDFCQAAFGYAGLDYRDYVVEDPRFYRPAETSILVADPSKANSKLGWTPAVGFTELVEMMVAADLESQPLR
jgi:GDPmannose 4,6-dehydratase